MDVDLAFAIGLGHDIGHAPFGNIGENAINEYFKSKLKFKFCHEIHGYRVVEYLANGGRGLNLTYAVRDGIICHNGEKFDRSFKPSETVKDFDTFNELGPLSNSYEGCIARHADKIAYLGRDIEDALVANFFKKKDIPENIRGKIGHSNGEIIDYLVKDLILNSKDGNIQFSESSKDLMDELYEFNKEKIYKNPRINQYCEFSVKIIKSILSHLDDLFIKLEFNINEYYRKELIFEKLFGRYLDNMRDFYQNEKKIRKQSFEKQKIQILIDYVAGMSDLYALDCMRELCIPKPIEFSHIEPKKDIEDVKRYFL